MSEPGPKLEGANYVRRHHEHGRRSEIQIALRIKIPMVLPSLIMTGLFSIVATLHYVVQSGSAEQMIKYPGSTFTGNATIIFDVSI